MVNQWIMFLRQYSKDNNISYSCAITEAAPSYRKMKEEMKKNMMSCQGQMTQNIFKNG